MNYCNCPNCRTDNCPAALETETVAAQETSQRSDVGCSAWLDALREEVERMIDEAHKEQKGVNFAMKPFYDGECFALKRIIERVERRLESASNGLVSHATTDNENRKS